ncbi:MAG: DNA internalization-related competence protein ComEC/Rec2 [Nitrospiraceae bacterium]|nr:DNA internalization-related competence protein ComEC/Rec2 [Nitrospiraceae bacterium]
MDKSKILSPLAVLILPFGLGIVAARAWYPELPGRFLFMAVVIGSGSLLSGICSRDQSQKTQRFLSWTGTAMVLFVLGFWHLNSYYRCLDNSSQDLLELASTPERHVIRVQVIRAPVRAANGISLIVAAFKKYTPSGSSPISGLMSVTVQGFRIEDIYPGDWIRIDGRLFPIRNFKTPGTFDQEGWWAIRGIKVKEFIGGPYGFSLAGHSRSSSAMSLPRYWLESARRRLILAIDRSLHGPAKGITMALLLGEKAWLSHRIRDAFARAGIGHLLAVSGLHMALVALLIGGLTRALLLRSKWILLRVSIKKIATFFALIGTVAYAGLADFSPSAVRAMVMISAFGLAFMIDRPQTSINTLALAAWSLLIFNPLYLFGISFQLSFTAVFFLIIFSPYLIPKTWKKQGRRQALLTKTRAFILITLIATLATAPIVAWYFQQMSLLGLVSNLLIVPLTSMIILPCMLLGAILLPISQGLASFVWQVVGWPLGYLVNFICLVSGWDWSVIWISRPTVLQVCLVYLFLGSFALIRYSKKFMALAVLSLFLFLSVSGYREYSLSHQAYLKLHVLDAGQGTFQVVELPGGRLMVVDSGGLRGHHFNIGERIVGPFIRYLGYRKIGVLVSSQSDRSYVGDLTALVRQFPVRELWTCTDYPRNLSYRQLLSACFRHGVRHRIWHNSGTEYIGDVRVDAWPIGSHKKRDSLLVLRLTYGKRSILLTGNIDRPRELQALSEGVIDPVDVLVVPNHGSNRSNGINFINKIRPETAIVPVWWKSSLGVPNLQVLARYRHIGSHVLRTDLDGTVNVDTDGNALAVGRYSH